MPNTESVHLYLQLKRYAGRVTAVRYLIGGRLHPITADATPGATLVALVIYGQGDILDPLYKVKKRGIPLYQSGVRYFPTYVTVLPDRQNEVPFLHQQEVMRLIHA